MKITFQARCGRWWIRGQITCSVEEQTSAFNAAEVFTVALKRPKAPRAGELQPVTKGRSVVIVTATLPGSTKGSPGFSSLSTEPCIPGSGKIDLKNRKQRLSFVGKRPRQKRLKAARYDN